MLTKINKLLFTTLHIGFIFLTWENATMTGARAETLRSKIAHIDTETEAVGHPGRLVYLSNGRVARIASKDAPLLTSAKDALTQGAWVEIKTNPKGFATFLKILARPDLSNPDYDLGGGLSSKFVEEDYQPTVLPNIQSAYNVFSSMNGRFRSRSQCYNRAMVWTYEAYNDWGLKSMKAFMFFTSKYIWEYNYGWWFHVTPFTYVVEDGQKVEKTLDYAFMDGPADMRDWTNFFITPKTECPTVTHYRDYDEHQNDHYCYLIKVPMYFWQPRDIEALDTPGTTAKKEFIKGDVDTAYWQGFY